MLIAPIQGPFSIHRLKVSIVLWAPDHMSALQSYPPAFSHKMTSGAIQKTEPIDAISVDAEIIGLQNMSVGNVETLESVQLELRR